MHTMILKVLSIDRTWTVARSLVAIVFIFSGFMKLLLVENSFKAMGSLGLSPEWFFSYSSAAIFLFSSFLILFDKALWLGAALLSISLILNIIFSFAFPNTHDSPVLTIMYSTLGHLSLIGGLLATSICSALKKQIQHHMEFIA
ncbi:DoxX family protein [Acinetobacter stercoris]|uniref:DoxX n=1 Tax=Acinetobacter stercoris TaxID=2126983 RepID=A0A2U3N0F0_9GAMM|nr:MULTISPECIES: DoxX family protein [Acinetobacter]SPL71142.1 DoxX [Acinetobacter stercoris]